MKESFETIMPMEMEFITELMEKKSKVIGIRMSLSHDIYFSPLSYIIYKPKNENNWS